MSDPRMPPRRGPLPEDAPEHLFDPGEFSVYQYFNGDDNQYERVRHGVSAEAAVEAVDHYCNNVAARMGLTHMVRITDGGDYVCFEWRNGQGVVFGLAGQEAPK